MAEAARLATEMAAQASLGHRRFCVGVHDHGELGVEEEWIDWSDAFARLAALARPSDTRRVVVTEEMVEAAARALHNSLGTIIPWDDVFPSMQDSYRKSARIAIDAAINAGAGQ
jgi:hypothetical protein